MRGYVESLEREHFYHGDNCGCEVHRATLSVTPPEIKAMNKTARSRGFIGRMAVCPKVIMANALPDDSILDFGSGPQALHTQRLRSKGFTDVTAWDIGDNFNPEIHDKYALTRQYDWVMASNVLNVQPDRARVLMVIDLLLMVTGGNLVVNYPRAPRKPGLTTAGFRNVLDFYFNHVEKVGQYVWVCKP